jgi:hypothetical protein
MGAALYGLAASNTIEWPDLQGNYRSIRIVRVAQPDDAGSRANDKIREGAE